MTIRLLSFNIHKGVGWRTRQSTLHVMHDELCLLNPDIVLLQEIRGKQLDLLTSTHWNYCSYAENVIHRKGHYGNAILSKFPILQAEKLNLSMHRFESRGLLYCMLKLPEISNVLHVVCLHLGLFRGDRIKQLSKVVGFVMSQIPSEEPLILGGDFNDWSGDATKSVVYELGLDEAFLNRHKFYARTYPAWSPFLKLDRIYYRGLKVSSAVRHLKKPWKNLSDHIAIEAHFEY